MAYLLDTWYESVEGSSPALDASASVVPLITVVNALLQFMAWGGHIRRDSTSLIGCLGLPRFEFLQLNLVCNFCNLNFDRIFYLFPA